MREDDADDEVGFDDGGMTVAAWATAIAVGLVVVVMALVWLRAMHLAGTGKGLF